VTNTGKISGIIDLEDGDDIFTGGNNAETVRDHNGADTTKLGGGNDRYIATGNSGADGIDSIDAGAGIDTYDASGSAISVMINLDIVVHDLAPFLPSAGIVAANTATGDNVAGAGLKDTIAGFENAKGGDTIDYIHGSGGPNILDGGGGRDILFGYGGNDTLIGGADIDVLTGGAGKDTLTGGTGADSFYLLAITDSGTSKGVRDTITDFNEADDNLDVTFIDANTVLAGNDAFDFIGVNAVFTNVAGQLRAYWTATGQIVQGDVNGDGKADFSIELIDPTHAIDFVAGGNLLV
jgi:Ca2+-binding RTX toxin-like protein